MKYLQKIFFSACKSTLILYDENEYFLILIINKFKTGYCLSVQRHLKFGDIGQKNVKLNFLLDERIKQN